MHFHKPNHWCLEMNKHVSLYEFAPASELGSADDYPVGSVEWAERISNRLQISALSVSTHTVHHLRKAIKEIWQAQPPPWEIWPTPPFGTPDDYCQAVTGHSWEFLVGVVAEFSDDPDLTAEKMRGELGRAQAEHRSQGTRTDLLPVQNRKLISGSTNAPYLLRRLARDYKDFLTRYEAGEYRSVRAAAIAAGMITIDEPFVQLTKQIKKHLPKLTADQREKLKAML
jgi:hypothetical protein